MPESVTNETVLEGSQPHQFPVGFMKMAEDTANGLIGAINHLAGERKPVASEIDLVLPNVDELNLADLQYVASRVETYRIEVSDMLEHKRNERVAILKERIQRDQDELADLDPTSQQPVRLENPSTPKYRDPEKPENTWTGRGKRPGWLREKLKDGAKLEDVLVGRPAKA